jgi:hypothetical protein
MEKQKFEDKWKDAFHGTEISPSENVWTNIELDLEKNESGGMRRKLLFYKTLAAASVVFAMAVGGTGIYFFNGNGAANLQQIALLKTEDLNAVNPPADKKIEAEKSELSSEAAKSAPESGKAITESNDPSEIEQSNSNPASSYTDEQAVSNEKTNKNSIKETQSNKPGMQSAVSGYVEQNNSDNAQNLQMELSAANLPALMTTPDPAFKMPAEKKNVETAQAADPVALMLAKLAEREKEIAEPKKNKSRGDEDLWTSVGVAAGSFNSTGTNVSPSPVSGVSKAQFNQTATKEAEASGFAYTVGVNMGKKVAERWVVQGGVNYLTQSSDYTAQTAVGSSDFQTFRPESINEFSNHNEGDVRPGDNKIITTAPYNVNNNVRYLSVPIQAGYLLIDKKFGLQFNAGVSTDLFLNNVKTAEGQNLDKITQGIGDDSPYRSMNFSGLLGTEFSYKFSSRYRVALNPGLRYPINSVYKSDLGVQSAPLSFDIGLRFRYIFH